MPLEERVVCDPTIIYTNLYNLRAAVARKSENRKTLLVEGATLGAKCVIASPVVIGECLRGCWCGREPRRKAVGVHGGNARILNRLAEGGRETICSRARQGSQTLWPERATYIFPLQRRRCDAWSVDL